MLLHINGKFTMRKLKSSLLSFAFCFVLNHLLLSIASCRSLDKAQWDICHQLNHQTYTYLVNGHHLYSGTWNLRIVLAYLCFREYSLYEVCVAMNPSTTIHAVQVNSGLICEYNIGQMQYKLDVCCIFFFFGDVLTYTYIPFEVMSCNHSFIFDRPIIYKTVKYVGQSYNSSWCILGIETVNDLTG
jgi:hypothetical protein